MERAIKSWIKRLTQSVNRAQRTALGSHAGAAPRTTMAQEKASADAAADHGEDIRSGDHAFLSTGRPAGQTRGRTRGQTRDQKQDQDLPTPAADDSMVALGPPTLRSLVAALVGAAFYFAFAYISIAVSRFDSTLAAIWLPNAAAVAFLLRMRLANELAFYAAALPASLFANALNGNPVDVALVFSLANMVSVVLVTGLTRRHCGPSPDMSDLVTLARFVFIGGMIGPLASASVAALALQPSMTASLTADGATAWAAILDTSISWFLTDSMGMILIVPVVLLISEASARALMPSPLTLVQGSALMMMSLGCIVLVFSQNDYPLLFLIMPMTMVHAFRLGSVGTAFHIALVAAVSTSMTWAGYGPIVEASGSPTLRLHLIQAFIAANFVTGLPIAAILAGRDRLTEALSKRRHELALLTNSITDAVLTLDERGVCTYASPSVEDVLGRDPKEFLGSPLGRLSHEDASQRFSDLVARLLDGQSEKGRLTFRRREDDANGVPVFIEVNCAVTLDPVSGEQRGVVISARDVTERVELELLLTRARRHAENAASAKSDFLANMSHEIRTPMNGVLGFAELMLQGDLDSEQRRHIEMIVQSGRSMMLLLNDILDLSKIEAGEIVIDTGPVNVHATLDECIALHRQTARKKGLALRLEHAPPTAEGTFKEPASANLEQWVITDGLRLRQIVLNLVSNAVKFTESGEIHVTYWASPDQLCVRVRDTGIGISSSRIETIFQPFTQAESDTARRFGGTGLGLSISRRLAQCLGGELNVDSEPGVGSTFRVTVPTQLVSTQENEPQRLDRLLPEDLPQHARILLVEDHDVNRALVTEMLERCGQSVASAHDGSEAISMVIDSNLRGRPYDLVLMDIQMPDCDGYSATRAIREEGIGPDSLPIIALTANVFPEDVVAAREAGMQAHLSKPVVFADLARALQRWLPTQIVEAPMDRDIALVMQTGAERDTRVAPIANDHRDAQAAGAAPFPTPEARARETEANAPVNDYTAINAPQRAPLVQKWLKRREEAVEAVRTGLATGLIAARDARRVQDQADRANLMRLIHKLAGAAGSFGEPELGQQAASLERAMKAGEADETCEAHAFALLALADEPGAAISSEG